MEASATAQPEAFNQLLNQHAQYCRQLEQLQSKPYLSDDEQLEETRLKKLKLQIKDQLNGAYGRGHAA